MKKRLLPLLPLLAVLLLLAGCTLPMMPAATEAMPAAEMAMPTPQPGVVSVENVRARPAPLAGGTAAAFLLLLNGTDAPVTLISAASDVAEAVELHETVEENGVMKMIPRPEGFEIPAGGAVELKPGGKHVMFIGLAAPLAVGDTFTLTLSYSDGSTLDVTVPVVEMEAAGAMSGMGDDAGHDMSGMGDDMSGDMSEDAGDSMGDDHGGMGGSDDSGDDATDDKGGDN